MALLPTNFPIPTPAAIATYDYVDIAAGLGYVAFYAFIADNAGTDAHYLTTSTAIGSKKAWIGPSAALIDNDFDSSPFNLPKTIKGDLYANIGVYRAAGNAGFITTTVTVSHVTSGGTPTELATATDSTPSNAGAASLPQDDYMCMRIPITSTHFKKGEYVRIHLSGSGGSAQGYFGLDPLDRSGAGSILPHSKTQFLIPFKLDEVS